MHPQRKQQLININSRIFRRPALKIIEKAFRRFARSHTKDTHKLKKTPILKV